MTPNTNAPDYDTPDASDDDDAYPYLLRNFKNKKKIINPNTYAHNDDAPDAADDYADSPNSLILYSSRKRKIDPKSMLKIKNI